MISSSSSSPVGSFGGRRILKSGKLDWTVVSIIRCICEAASFSYYVSPFNDIVEGVNLNISSSFPLNVIAF